MRVHFWVLEDLREHQQPLALIQIFEQLSDVPGGAGLLFELLRLLRHRFVLLLHARELGGHGFDLLLLSLHLLLHSRHLVLPQALNLRPRIQLRVLQFLLVQLVLLFQLRVQGLCRLCHRRKRGLGAQQRLPDFCCLCLHCLKQLDLLKGRLELHFECARLPKGLLLRILQNPVLVREGAQLPRYDADVLAHESPQHVLGEHPQRVRVQPRAGLHSPDPLAQRLHLHRPLVRGDERLGWRDSEGVGVVYAQVIRSCRSVDRIRGHLHREVRHDRLAASEKPLDKESSAGEGSGGRGVDLTLLDQRGAPDARSRLRPGPQAQRAVRP
mmetsp:Transcript_52941/g.129299  ORF Transcript_52941/g.129299 Transcript_52941/m.129299 type:complete len:326 (-) Transcript_52941:461-1438(-)